MHLCETTADPFVSYFQEDAAISEQNDGHFHCLMSDLDAHHSILQHAPTA